MSLKVKRLHDKAKLPIRSSKSAAGYDFFTPHAFSIDPLDRIKVDLGVAVEIPEGYVGQFRERSGHALRLGITVLAGTIDSDYRGDLGVILFNTGYEVAHFMEGDKICQMVIHQIFQEEIEEVSELSNTERGAGGFGSTGK